MSFVRVIVLHMNLDLLTHRLDFDLCEGIVEFEIFYPEKGMN